MRVLPALGACLLYAACEGPEGPPGTPGAMGLPGDKGAPGAPGQAACDPVADTGPALATTIAVSRPQNGSFFAAGEAPELTIRFLGRCGRPLRAADLGTADLYLYGPRRATHTRTAIKLLNCVTDRMARDRQHHYINLIAPAFADPQKSGMSMDADGTITYRLAAVSDEEPGTYTASVWAKSKDEKEQLFPLVDLQIGTATPESYASGPADNSSCEDCHKGAASGKMYMHHIVPGFSPLGNYAIDQYPIGTCKSCHNLDGYSPNPILRKVHAVHHGEHQLAPRAAHPEYGLKDPDATLAAYTNVGFPSMPDQDKDCEKCHRDDRWASAPSRLGCGTCHDNLFFDTGKLDPPTPLGQPAGKACAADTECAAFGQLASCDTMSKSCMLKSHPKQEDDSQCATCHTKDNSGISPVPARHEILSRTRVRGLKITGLALSGDSGKAGTFQVGDTPTVAFKLSDKTGAVIEDLIANKNLSPTLVLAGPTDDRQRVYGPLGMKAQGKLTYDAASRTYSYVLPGPFPAQSLSPFNTDPAAGMRVNPPGTYTVWVYVYENLSAGGASFRDSGGALLDFRFGDETLPLRPQQVVSQAACDSCHVQLQAHGGTRRDVAACSMCHTQGAVDRTIGAKGTQCKMDGDCGGAAAGWEACQDTNMDGQPDTCAITVDPTPNQSIFLPYMIHSVHFARLREGYAERNNLVNPGSLSIVGYMNSVNDFSQVLLPQDVRNCTKCHADNGAACSSNAQCGHGQRCSAGTCRSSTWKTEPSGAVCLSCHDADDSNGHVAIMTWQSKDGPVETCNVCHGEHGDFAVEKVHNISSPYRPPYNRVKE